MTTATSAKIPDPGLFLGVLQAMLEQELLSQDRLDPALADIETSDDEDGDEQERVAAAVARLHETPLPDEGLARVERIDFDGGNDIYMLIEEVLDIDTGGEADYYCLGSLQGIGALTSLVALNLDGHGYRQAPLDLSPLAGHPALADLYLTGVCTNAAVLTTLPALAKLRTRASDLDDPTVLDRLRQRGVEVREG
jgi:hypothetical protein